MAVRRAGGVCHITTRNDVNVGIWSRDMKFYTPPETHYFCSVPLCAINSFFQQMNTLPTSFNSEHNSHDKPPSSPGLWYLVQFQLFKSSATSFVLFSWSSTRKMLETRLPLKRKLHVGDVQQWRAGSQQPSIKKYHTNGKIYRDHKQPLTDSRGMCYSQKDEECNFVNYTFSM